MGVDNLFTTSTLELPTELCETLEKVARVNRLSVPDLLKVLLNESHILNAQSSSDFETMLKTSVDVNGSILAALTEIAE